VTRELIFAKIHQLEANADPLLENNQGHTPMMLASRTRTKRALEGLLKETLKREELEREQREQAMMEERKRLMAEMENEVALRSQAKVPLLSPRHDSDGDADEVCYILDVHLISIDVENDTC